MPKRKSSVKKINRSRPSSKVRYEESCGNVFKDLGFSKLEANKKLLKCQLMLEIERAIKANGWTQTEAARRLGVVQPRISEIMTTRIERFTLDMLLRYLNRLGKYVRMTVTDRLVA